MIIFIMTVFIVLAWEYDDFLESWYPAVHSVHSTEELAIRAEKQIKGCGIIPMKVNNSTKDLSL